MHLAPNTNWSFVLLLVCATWLGCLFGVSFIATPAKFLAPSLTLPIALDVGRHTFLVFAAFECVALALAGISTILQRGDSTYLFLVFALLVIMTAQYLGLYPSLSERTDLILGGADSLPDSNAHHLYVALELSKLLLLGIISLKVVKLLKRQS
ncbi:MAG: hypothetical protein AAF420_06570 [Pseudomonadota bacterium]